jgi:hypothetical protein
MPGLGGIYETGTITILVGTPKIVTGTGTLWSPGIVAEEGDWIWSLGSIGIIETVNSDTQITLEANWVGTLPSNSPYQLIKMSWLRYDPAITQAKLRELLAELDDTLPATATLNAVARFAAADGKKLKNSSVIVSDAGAVQFQGYGVGNLKSDASGNITSSSGSAPIPMVARSSDTQIVAADHDKHFFATGTFTQTFATGASLGNGFRCRYRNGGAGIITLNAPSGGTINGASTLPLHPNQDIYIECDGTSLWTSDPGPRTGTFTPGIAFGGSSVGVTYSAQTGKYIRHLDHVRFNFTLTLSSKGTSTGAVSFTGLPFVSNIYAPCSVWANAITQGGVATFYQPRVEISTSTIVFYISTTGTAVTLVDTNIANTSNFQVSGGYTTSAA